MVEWLVVWQCKQKNTQICVYHIEHTALHFITVVENAECFIHRRCLKRRNFLFQDVFFSARRSFFSTSPMTSCQPLVVELYTECGSNARTTTTMATTPMATTAQQKQMFGGGNRVFMLLSLAELWRKNFFFASRRRRRRRREILKLFDPVFREDRLMRNERRTRWALKPSLSHSYPLSLSHFVHIHSLAICQRVRRLRKECMCVKVIRRVRKKIIYKEERVSVCVCEGERVTMGVCFSVVLCLIQRIREMLSTVWTISLRHLAV